MSGSGESLHLLLKSRTGKTVLGRVPSASSDQTAFASLTPALTLHLRQSTCSVCLNKNTALSISNAQRKINKIKAQKKSGANGFFA